MALKGNGLRPEIWNCDITDSWKGRRPQWRGLSESVREQSAMPRFQNESVNLREPMRRIAEDVANAIRDAKADQLCSGGANSRNGYREHNPVSASATSRRGYRS